MDYKRKYLKYKAKYTELKSQIGQGVERHPYIAVVPEFRDKTNDLFKNETPRQLNTIVINHNLDGNVDYEHLATIIESNKEDLVYTCPEIDEFMGLLEARSDKIIQIDGFFNSYKNYVNELNEGTYVESKDYEKVFKEPIPVITKDISNITITGFFSTDGAGKKNLNKVMNKYKAKGIKYVMLEAGGKEKLVGLYNKYGLESILDGYNYFGSRATNNIMFANIDNIIAKTN